MHTTFSHDTFAATEALGPLTTLLDELSVWIDSVDARIAILEEEFLEDDDEASCACAELAKKFGPVDEGVKESRARLLRIERVQAEQARRFDAIDETLADIHSHVSV